MRTFLPAVALTALVLGVACESRASSLGDAGICDTLAAHDGSARLGVLSAFPAELHPLAAALAMRQRVEIGGHPFYTGELAGLRVVLSQTNIGMLNAASTTELLLANFDVAAIVFSGVAGSPHRIGDVTVPLEFRETSSGLVFTAEPLMVALARKLKTVKLERCTDVPASGQHVCLRFRPRIFVGGLGESGDPFGGRPFECQPDDNPVFGCDVGPLSTVAAQAKPVPDPVAQDMETAAVARVAQAHGIPWVAFRAVSDGPGDPLGLPGFPAQFFAYYNLAAHNAAQGTMKFLGRVARVAGRPGGRSRLCRLAPAD
jgi:adenosylhomocysteine nucleosidase